MKKHCTLIIIALSLLCGAAASEQESLWALSTGVHSKYIGKIGGIFSEDPILATSLDWSRGELFAGIWSSTGLGRGRYGSTYADEVDLYVGYGHKFNQIRIQADVAYYTIKSLGLMNDDILAFDGEISFPKLSFIQPYAAFRRFGAVGHNTVPGGMFYWAGVRCAQSLGGQKLNLDAMTAYSDGALGKDSGFVFARLTVNLPIALTKRTTLTPSVVLQMPVGGQDQHQLAYTTRNEIVWGLTLEYKP